MPPRSRTSEASIPHPASRRTVSPHLLGAGLLALGVAGCGPGGCAGEPGDALEAVPADARAVAVAPSGEALRERLVELLRGVQGASGVLDLLEARYGLDLRQTDVLRRVGLAARRRVAAFARDDVVGLAAGVVDAGRLDARLSRILRKRLGASIDTPDGPAGLRGTARAPTPRDDADATPAWRLAWGVTDRRVAVLLAMPGAAEPAERWRAFAEAERAALPSEGSDEDGPPAEGSTPDEGADDGGGASASDEALLAGPAARRAREGLGDVPGLWGVARGAPPLPEGLGMAKAYLASYARNLSRWSGHLAVRADRLALAVDGHWTGDGALPVDWIRVDDPAPRFAELLPRSLTAFLRLRFSPQRILELPDLLLNRVMPAKLGAGPLARALPGPKTLLELTTGDVALAFLGLDEEATVEQLRAARGRPSKLMQLVHVAAAMSVREPKRIDELLDGAAERLGGRGWSTPRVEAQGWRGYSFDRGEGGMTWSAVRHEDTLVVLTGGGEVERLLAVAEGRALPLGRASEGEVVERALSGTRSPLGVLLTFTRLARELSSKGLPPYFLEMLSDVRAVAGALALRADGVGVDLDLRL